MLTLALFNLLRNKRRNILLLLFITISAASLSLFVGYSEYTKFGMKLGATSSTGHIAIATKKYWNSSAGVDGSTTLMHADGVRELLQALSNVKAISTNRIIEFSGLIGTEFKSSVFLGAGYEDIKSIQQTLPVEGGMVYNDDRGRILAGSELTKSLGTMQGDIVNITVNTEYGLGLYSQELSGIVTMPERNIDKLIVLTNIENAWDLLGNDGAIHKLQIFINDNNKEEKIMADIHNIIVSQFPDLETKTWKELNKSFTEVVSMYNAILFFLIINFLAFIFISILQTVINISLERMKEFGTLRALGLYSLGVVKMVMWEMIIISTGGLCLGVMFAFFAKFIVKVLHLTFTPPGSAQAYPIDFFFNAGEVVGIVIIPILFTVFLSCIYPLRRVAQLEVTKVLEG